MMLISAAGFKTAAVDQNAWLRNIESPVYCGCDLCKDSFLLYRKCKSHNVCTVSVCSIMHLPLPCKAHKPLYAERCQSRRS